LTWNVREEWPWEVEIRLTGINAFTRGGREMEKAMAREERSKLTFSELIVCNRLLTSRRQCPKEIWKAGDQSTRLETLVLHLGV
jgi:hypothetical protein